MKHVFDYMEYTWANNVIAYDRGRRDNLIQNVDAKLTNTSADPFHTPNNAPAATVRRNAGAIVTAAAMYRTAKRIGPAVRSALTCVTHWAGLLSNE